MTVQGSLKICMILFRSGAYVLYNKSFDFLETTCCIYNLLLSHDSCFVDFEVKILRHGSPAFQIENGYIKITKLNPN